MTKLFRPFISISLSVALVWTAGQGAEAALFLNHSESIPGMAYRSFLHNQELMRVETQALSVRPVSSGSQLGHHPAEGGLLTVFQSQAPRLQNNGFEIVETKYAESKSLPASQFWKVAGAAALVAGLYSLLPSALALMHSMPFVNWLLGEWVAQVAVPLILLSLGGIAIAHIFKGKTFGRWTAGLFSTWKSKADGLKRLPFGTTLAFLAHLPIELPLIIYGFGFKPVVRLLQVSFTGHLPANANPVEMTYFRLNRIHWSLAVLTLPLMAAASLLGKRLLLKLYSTAGRAFLTGVFAAGFAIFVYAVGAASGDSLMWLSVFKNINLLHLVLNAFHAQGALTALFQSHNVVIDAFVQMFSLFGILSSPILAWIMGWPGRIKHQWKQTAGASSRVRRLARVFWKSLYLQVIRKEDGIEEINIFGSWANFKNNVLKPAWGLHTVGVEVGLLKWGTAFFQPLHSVVMLVEDRVMNGGEVALANAGINLDGITRYIPGTAGLSESEISQIERNPTILARALSGRRHSLAYDVADAALTPAEVAFAIAEGSIIKAATPEQAAPSVAKVAPVEQTTTLPKLIPHGTNRLAEKVTKQRDVNKTTDDQVTAQTRADHSAVLSVLATAEKGPDLHEISTPEITFMKGGDGAVTQHENRQDKIKNELDRPQKEAIQRQAFNNALFDGYNRFVVANADIKILTESLDRARVAASKMGDTSDGLEKAEANTVPALERDLEAAKVAAQDGFDAMRQAMQLPHDQLPASFTPDVPDTEIDWDVVKDLFAEGKSADPDTLATALNMANNVDHVKAAIEVGLRSNLEKMKPANWTFNLIPLFRSFTYWDLMSVATPNFVTYDKFDGKAEASLLKEAKNSFLAQRAQHFSDLNGMLQTLSALAKEVDSQEAQADKARQFAEDQTRSPAERQSFNHEAAQADLAAQQTLQRANEVYKNVHSTVAAAKDALQSDLNAKKSIADIDEFVTNMGDKSSDQLKEFAKQLVEVSYAAAVQKAFASVSEEQKSVQNPKPGSKRDRESKQLLAGMNELQTVAKQSIDEDKDSKADLDNGLLAADRTALSSNSRKTTITAYGAHVTQATSNQIDAATMKNKSPAVGPTYAVEFSHTSRVLKEAMEHANTASMKLAKLQKADRQANDQDQEKISDIEGKSIDELDKALEIAETEAHHLSEKASDPKDKEAYTYRESQIASQRADLKVVKSQVDAGTVPLPQGVNAPSVDQLVTSHALAKANFEVAMHPVKKATLSGTSLSGTKVSFNYVTGLINPYTWDPLKDRLASAVRHIRGKEARPGADESKAIEVAQEFEITAKDQIAHISAAHQAAKDGRDLYKAELEARQEALKAAQAKEVKARQGKSPDDILTTGATTLQRQADLAAIQREKQVFELLAKNADDEFATLDRILGKDPKSLTNDEQEFRKKFVPFYNPDKPDSVDVDKATADLRAKLAADLKKMPATYGLNGWGAPYLLVIQDADAPPLYKVGGFHLQFSYDAEGRQTHKEAVASDKDNAEAAQEDAHEKSDVASIQDKVHTETLGSIAKMTSDLKDEMDEFISHRASISNEQDVLDANALKADLRVAAVAAKRNASDDSKVLSARPIVLKVEKAEGAVQAATLIANRRYPDPGPAVKKGKIPVFTVTGGAHGYNGHQFTFAGVTANIGKFRLRHSGLAKANKVKDTAKSALDNRTLEGHRIDRINQVASRFRHIQGLVIEFKKAEEESVRARAALDDYKALVAAGGAGPGKLADSVESYRQAAQSVLLLQGDLEQVNALLDLDLAKLTPQEMDSFGIKKVGIESVQPAKDRLTDTDLAVRVLTQKVAGPDADHTTHDRVKAFVKDNNLTADQVTRLKGISDTVNAEPPEGSPNGKIDAFESNLAYAIFYMQAMGSGNGGVTLSSKDALGKLARGEFDQKALVDTMAEVRNFNIMVRDTKTLNVLNHPLAEIFDKFAGYATSAHSLEARRAISVAHALWVDKHPEPTLTPDDLLAQIETAGDFASRTYLKKTSAKIFNGERLSLVVESFNRAQDFRERLPKPLPWPEVYRLETVASNDVVNFDPIDAPWKEIMTADIQLLLADISKMPEFAKAVPLAKAYPADQVVTHAPKDGIIQPSAKKEDSRGYLGLGQIVRWIRSNSDVPQEYKEKVKGNIWDKGGAVDKLWKGILEERQRQGKHLKNPDPHWIYPSDLINLKDLITKVFGESVVMTGLVLPDNVLVTASFAMAVAPSFNMAMQVPTDAFSGPVMMSSMMPPQLLPFALAGSLLWYLWRHVRPRFSAPLLQTIIGQKAELEKAA